MTLTFGNQKLLAMAGNQQLLAMVTNGSQVGKHEFQPLGTGSPLQWQPLVATLATMCSNLWELAVPCNSN